MLFFTVFLETSRQTVVRYQRVNKTPASSQVCWDTSELYHLSAGYMGNDRLDRPLGLHPRGLSNLSISHVPCGKVVQLLHRCRIMKHER